MDERNQVIAARRAGVPTSPEGETECPKGRNYKKDQPQALP